MDAVVLPEGPFRPVVAGMSAKPLTVPKRQQPYTRVAPQPFRGRLSHLPGDWHHRLPNGTTLETHRRTSRAAVLSMLPEDQNRLQSS